MGIEKLLVTILEEGAKNPDQKIGEALSRANPFLIKNIDKVYAGWLEHSVDLEYVRKFWDITEKSKVPLENLDFIFNNISPRYVKESKEDSKKSLHKIIDYVVENRLEEWLTRLLKNNQIVNNQTEINFYRFDWLIVSTILKNETYVKKLKEALEDGGKFGAHGKRFKGGMLFQEFSKNNKFINVFYEGAEGEEAFNNFSANEVVHFVDEQRKNHCYQPYYLKQVTGVREIIKAGLKLGIKNKSFELLYNKVLGALLDREFNKHMVFNIIKDVIEIIEGREHLKIDKNNQQKLGIFIKIIDKERQKEKITKNSSEEVLLQGKDIAYKLARLEELQISLLNQTAKKTKTVKI